MNIVLFQPLSVHVQALSQAQWGIPSQKHSWSFPSLSNAVLYIHHLGIHCNLQHFVLNYTVKTNLFSHRLVFYFFFQFSMSLPCTHNLNDVWCLKLQQFLGGIFFFFWHGNATVCQHVHLMVANEVLTSPPLLTINKYSIRVNFVHKNLKTHRVLLPLNNK